MDWARWPRRAHLDRAGPSAAGRCVKLEVLLPGAGADEDGAPARAGRRAFGLGQAGALDLACCIMCGYSPARSLRVTS
jgi:hypothetical protein